MNSWWSIRHSGVQAFGHSGETTVERSHTPMEDLEVFRRYVDVADWVWDAVERWPKLAQDTVGAQLIRACDSVGANLVEGDGRATDPDPLRFFVIARASAREGRYWLNRAIRRRLIPPADGEARIAELVSATQLLNKLIGYRRASSGRMREEMARYDSTDPFVELPDLNA